MYFKATFTPPSATRVKAATSKEKSPEIACKCTFGDSVFKTTGYGLCTQKACPLNAR